MTIYLLDGVTVDLGPGLWPTLAELGAHVAKMKRVKRVRVRRCTLAAGRPTDLDGRSTTEAAVLGARGRVLYSWHLSASDQQVAAAYFR